MTNVLFIGYSLEPSRGGIERVTDSVAYSLTHRGFSVYGVYDRANPMTEQVKNKYVRVLGVNLNIDFSDDLARFVKDNSVSVIVNQLAQNNNVLSSIERLLNTVNDVKIISCLHTHPTYLAKEYRMFLTPLIHRGFAGWIKLLIKRLLAPFIVWRKVAVQKAIYRRGYALSDRYILLSEKFKKVFARYVNLEDSSKLCALPNPLSFSDVNVDVNQKESWVLVVSRICLEKRIDLALKSWSEVEKLLPKDSQWRLKIVGDGYMLPYLKNEREKLGLKRVDFEGHQSQPIEYYKKSRIYLMTSLYEGFGMSISEAQQCGAVPIAMNSYESLMDLIENDRNGIVVPDNDVSAMTISLVSLIANEELLNKMARYAIIDSDKFGIEGITNRWVDLIEEL